MSNNSLIIADLFLVTNWILYHLLVLSHIPIYYFVAKII